ncbi:MAG: methyltransferase [Treponema sp.]|jgi:23S rRNA (uracil1939-C5)-methyltransferase|nr:methyltransferase [Treponema sp.]
MMSETLRGTVESIAPGGEGFFKQDGKSFFVGLSAPGDTIAFRVTEEHKSWARGALLEVLSPGPGRVTPVCPCYGICGGCSLGHLSYESQIEAKKTILADSFLHIGKIFQLPVIKVTSGQPFEYRNRARLHVDGNALGFKARGSGAIVPLGDCPACVPELRRFLARAAETPLPRGAAEITLYARNGTLLREGGQRRGKITFLDKDLSVDCGLFFQSNGALLERLITALREAAARVDEGLPLADLYCGVGTFAAFLGERFSGGPRPAVTLVEANKSALALACENCAAFPLEAAAQDCGTWARAHDLSRYGMVVCDPPRQGLSAGLAAALAERGPRLLAYVSCNPASLARDAAILRAGGFFLDSLGFFDFYPHTAHIEALALFTRDAA